MMHKEFAVHMLNTAGKAKAARIAAAFDTLLDEIESLCPEGRELAIVRTKLEEGCFFVKKAMASAPVNTGDDPPADEQGDAMRSI
jgi:hypothetical protein